MSDFKTITHGELKQWLDEEKDFVLLNVLAEDSFNARHLPHSQHADSHEPDFLEQVAELVPSKDEPLVVYCSSFTCQRSPKAARRLAEAGYTQVYDFEGGLADWKDAGYVLEGEAVE